MKILGWVIIIILVFILYSLISPSKSRPVRTTVDNTSLLNEIKQEPKVKDAVITDAGVLYVAVLHDGTNRTGYANYLCEVLRAKGSSVQRVKVIKYGSQNSPKKDNAYGVLLGESWCK